VTTSSIARGTGLALGLTLAVGLFLSGRVPEGSAQAPAHLSLVAKPAIQLGVSPLGTDIMARAAITPGGPAASGSVSVSNLTGTPLAATPLLKADDTSLDELVELVVTADGARIYSGNLAGLRSGRAAQLRLPATAKRRIRFRASLPSEAGMATQGRSVKLTLGWRTRRAGR
jgi:hypothetical protein